jgi:glycosyltransferase involved in cell wall biosynthesis
MSLTYLILNYNNSIYLKECIDSVLNVMRDKDEILIIDDHSMDRSWDIISEYEGKHKDSCYRNRENLGMYASIKFHLGKVKTDYLTVVDSDDIITYPLSEFIRGNHVVRYMFQLIHGTNLEDSSFLYPGRDFDIDENLSALGSILKNGNYVGSTTSGNIYNTETLKKLTKNFDYTNKDNYFDSPSFDGFIHRKIAFEGDVYAYKTVVGLYRKHEKNNGSKFSMFSLRKVKRSLLVIGTDISYLNEEYGINPKSAEAIFMRDKRVLLTLLLGDLYALEFVLYLKKVFSYFVWFNQPRSIFMLVKAHLTFFKSLLWT